MLWFKNKNKIYQKEYIEAEILRSNMDKFDSEVKKISSRRDSVYTNYLTGLGTSRDSNESTTIKTWKPYSFVHVENLYMDPSIRKITSKIVETVFKEEFFIETQDEKYSENFLNWMKENELHVLLRKLYESGLINGHAFLFINDGREPDVPLDLRSKIKIQDIQLINRWFLSTLPEEVDFIFNPKYYWTIQHPYGGGDGVNSFMNLSPALGTKIHHTRLFGCFGIELQPYLFRANLHFHDSYIKKIEQSALNYRVALDNLASAMSHLPMAISKIDNLTSILANPEQRQKLAESMAARQRVRSTHNVSVMDVKEEYSYFWPSLAGVAEVMKHLEEALCLDSDVPHDVLFGEGSHGATTGRTEKTNFQKFISSEQKIKLEPIIVKLMLLAHASGGPKMPKDAKISFNHYEEPTELEKSQIFVAEAGAIAALEAQGYDCSEYLINKQPLIKRDMSFSEMENSKSETEEIEVRV